MISIPLHKLPTVSRRQVRNAVEWNLTPAHIGNGNRSRRRAGLSILNPRNPAWSHAMDRRELAQFLKTIP